MITFIFKWKKTHDIVCLSQADIKLASGAQRPSLICKAKILKIYYYLLKYWGWLQGMGMGHTNIWTLASKNEALPHRIMQGLTEWGLASHNEIWPHLLRSGLTKRSCPQIMRLFLKNDVRPQIMRSGLTAWGLTSHNKIRPHLLRSGLTKWSCPQRIMSGLK